MVPGTPTADLVFVGEAPGFHEDQQGIPFVGAAGKLLDKLLAGIGLAREDVYIANVLKCRPPGNRDPQPEEIEACESHLFRQIELIQPKVVATLGNFATKLLSGKPLGITRVHGQEQEVVLGGSRVLLYPLYHPAAALYTPRCSRCFGGLCAVARRCSVGAHARASGAPSPPEPDQSSSATGPVQPVLERRASSARREPRTLRPELALEFRGGVTGRWSRGRSRGRPAAGLAAGLAPATSSPCPVSSAPARRPSSAAPAGRSA